MDAFCSVFSELPLALIEIFLQQGIHDFGLLEHKDGGFEVSGLKAAEFLEGAMEGALGGGAGAVDGGLKAVEFFVGQVLRRRYFETGATTEAPCGLNDLAGEGLLERGRGREFGEVAGLEFIKDVLLFRADEIRNGEETRFGCVLRNASLTCGRDRAG